MGVTEGNTNRRQDANVNKWHAPICVNCDDDDDDDKDDNDDDDDEITCNITIGELQIRILQKMSM